MADLKRAIQAYGRAKESEKAATRRHIISEAKRLKHPELIPSNWPEAPKAVKVSATVAALRARVHGVTAAVYLEWQHPRGLHGKWIEKGAIVNIHMPGGKKRRGKIDNLTQKGPEVTYDDDSSKEIIPLKDADKRIEVAPQAVARLNAPTAKAPTAPAAPKAPQAAPPKAATVEPYVPKRDEEGKLIVSPESAAMGKQIYDRAVAGEPELTKKLAALVEDSDPENYMTPESGGGGELYGYKYRLKAEAGISEKIERYIADEGLTREQAAGEIKDANRYTIHYPEDSLGPNAQRILDSIAADPNTAKMNVKNTWPPELNRAYKGINVNVWTKDGMVYEIQFHTPKSQAVKDKMHALYEDQRTKTVAGSPEWQKYEDEMKNMAKTLPMPTGAAEVKTPDVGGLQSGKHMEYERQRIPAAPAVPAAPEVAASARVAALRARVHRESTAVS